MLITRLSSALLGIILLIVIVAATDIYLSIALAIVSIIALNELFNAFKTVNLKPVAWVGYASSLLILVNRGVEKGQILNLIYFEIFAIIFILFLHVVFSSNKINFIDISATFTSIFYIVFLLSFVVMTRHLDKGNLFIWIIFIGGWGTDSAAYFIGKHFGKKKLTSVLSPKKTLEGSIGGVVLCTMATFFYGIAINHYFNINIKIVHYIIIGLIISVISQIGDLAASSIKRFTNIKDFGNVMPGHGGIIDRFDSIILAAPVVYFYLKLLSF